MASCPGDCTIANPQHAVASEVLEDKLRPTRTVASICRLHILIVATLILVYLLSQCFGLLNVCLRRKKSCAPRPGRTLCVSRRGDELVHNPVVGTRIATLHPLCHTTAQ